MLVQFRELVEREYVGARTRLDLLIGWSLVLVHDFREVVERECVGARTRLDHLTVNFL